MTLPALKWKPSPNFGSRHGALVNKLVLHDTEGSYEGAIATFLGAGGACGRVSAHFVIKEDGSEATQMVDLADAAWHARVFNSCSVGFEMAGFSAKGYESAEWQAAANILAFHLHHLQIPCKWARGGVGPGFCSHYDLGAAGGGHRDPVTDAAKWQQFVALVTEAYQHGNFPAVWGVEHGLTKCGLAAEG